MTTPDQKDLEAAIVMSAARVPASALVAVLARRWVREQKIDADEIDPCEVMNLLTMMAAKRGLNFDPELMEYEQTTGKLLENYRASMTVIRLEEIVQIQVMRAAGFADLTNEIFKAAGVRELLEGITDDCL